MKRIILHGIPLLVALVLVCACVGTLVKSGEIRDTIGNVEQTVNGNWRVWFTHDTAAGYCTCDNKIGEYAKYLLENHDGEVILKYKSIREGDPEYDAWQKSGCGSITKGESYMEMFAIVEIIPVRSRLLAVPGE